MPDDIETILYMLNPFYLNCDLLTIVDNKKPFQLYVYPSPSPLKIGKPFVPVFIPNMYLFSHKRPLIVTMLQITVVCHLKPLKIKFIIVNRDPCLTGNCIEHYFIAHVDQCTRSAAYALKTGLHSFDHASPLNCAQIAL